jgi:hypothetical protein
LRPDVGNSEDICSRCNSWPCLAIGVWNIAITLIDLGFGEQTAQAGEIALGVLVSAGAAT